MHIPEGADEAIGAPGRSKTTWYKYRFFLGLTLNSQQLCIFFLDRFTGQVYNTKCRTTKVSIALEGFAVGALVSGPGAFAEGCQGTYPAALSVSVSQYAAVEEVK